MPTVIKKAIEEKELTVRRVADALGVTEQAVYNWINDVNRVDPQYVRPLIALLGLTWDEIYPPNWKKASND